MTLVLPSVPTRQHTIYNKKWHWRCFKDSRPHQKNLFQCFVNEKANLTVENDRIAANICVKQFDVKVGSKHIVTTHVIDICEKVV